MKKTATKKDSQEESVKETKKTTKKTIKKASSVAAEQPAPAAEASPEEGKVEIVQRYSKEELEEFRQIIERKLADARKDLELLQENFKGFSESDTSDTSPTFKILEEGQSALSTAENGRLAMRQEKFIQSLENALIRINNGTYGVCRVTGKLIPKERLRVVPHATLSVEGKLMLQEREKRNR
ncbi:MAG: TraR/DksA family transcriptional regulator [Bacteroidales bacterium]|nr:TraR/DksA family transcriptional regulator [Bacteroidales bacterium]